MVASAIPPFLAIPPEAILVSLQLQFHLLSFSWGSLPVGLNIILSSDWPIVVIGLVQWVGLWEHPGWLSTLDTLDRPVRNVAVWGEGGGKGWNHKIGLNKTQPWQYDPVISVFMVILPLRVWTVAEIWPQSFSGFLLCQLSFCVLRGCHSCYCWSYNRHRNLQTAKTDSWKHFLCSLPATYNEFSTNWPNYWLRNNHA